MVSQFRIRAISLDNAKEVGSVLGLLCDTYPNTQHYRRLIEEGSLSDPSSANGHLPAFTSLGVYYLDEPIAHLGLVLDVRDNTVRMLFAAYEKQFEDLRPQLNYLIWNTLVDLGRRQGWGKVLLSDCNPSHVLRSFTFEEFSESILQILPYDSLEESIETVAENEDVMLSQIGLGPAVEQDNRFKNAGKSGS